MASPRITDTGAEVRPVELTAGGGQVVACATPATDGYATTTWSLPVIDQVHLFNGAGWDRWRGANVFKDIAAVAIVAGTPQTIWTPAAGKRFRLMGFMLSSTTAAALIFKYAAANTTMWRTPVLAAAGVIIIEALGNGHMPGAVNDPLKLDATVSTTVSGAVWGIEEA